VPLSTRFFSLLLFPPPPISTLFPYTTLFRSCNAQRVSAAVCPTGTNMSGAADCISGSADRLLGLAPRPLLRQYGSAHDGCPFPDPRTCHAPLPRPGFQAGSRAFPVFICFGDCR